MENEVILGVDVSKSWLDVHLLVNGADRNNAIRIKNSPVGFSKLVKWIEGVTQIHKNHWLVCMEHTGLYSYRFNMFLQQSTIGQSMVNALAIKKSMGIIRGKNDKADAKLIAHYARRFKDTLRLFQLPSISLQKLKVQLSQRDRMVDMKRQIDLSMQNMEDLPKEVMVTVNKQNKKLTAQLLKNIKELDLAIKETISCDVNLKTQSNRMESIPGIGPQISANILVTTQAMTLFKNSRQYACYAGIAPFEHKSGSSYRSRTKVHFLANRKIKSLLHMAALNAITFDPEIKTYFERKKAEGKNAMSIINAVRFKLIDRIFAVIRKEQLYDKSYISVLCNNNT